MTTLYTPDAVPWGTTTSARHVPLRLSPDTRAPFSYATSSPSLLRRDAVIQSIFDASESVASIVTTASPPERLTEVGFTVGAPASAGGMVSPPATCRLSPQYTSPELSTASVISTHSE